MKRYTTLLAVLGALVLTTTACSINVSTDPADGVVDPTDDDDDVNDGNTPDPSDIDDIDPANLRTHFDEKVAPALQAQCAGACHATGGITPAFVAPEVAGVYESVNLYRSTLMGDIDPGTDARIYINGLGNHYGATYLETEKADVLAWLQAELEAELNGEGPGPSPMDRLVACMKTQGLAVFEQADIAEQMSNKQSQDGRCEACHNSNEEGFIASDDDGRVFYVLTELPASALNYFMLDPQNPETWPIVNLTKLQAVGQRQAPNQNHPSYEMNPNEQVIINLNQYLADMQAADEAGLCGPIL